MTPALGDAHLPAIAAFGLPTEHRLPVDEVPRTAAMALVDRCEREGILGLLGEAVRSRALTLSTDARAALELRLRAQAGHDLSVERTLLRLTDALTGAALEWRAVGAPALARTAYPRPELRSLDRAEVLVHAADADRARVICGSVVATDSGVVRTLPDEPDDLFGPPYRFPLGGFELSTLPMPQRLLVLCAGADTAGGSRLAALRDVAEVLLREQPNVADVLLLAHTWKCEAQLASTLVNAWDRLALTEPPAVVTWARMRG
jgi:Uncharacterised nucleotidyltransferase